MEGAGDPAGLRPTVEARGESERCVSATFSVARAGAGVVYDKVR